MSAGADQGGAPPPAESAADRIRTMVERVLEALDLEADVELAETGEGIEVEVTGASADELGLLIGRHGQTIDALQLLCYQAAQRSSHERLRVTVDAAGYRERRRAALERRAERAAEEAIRVGRPVELEAMTPGERRVVHEHLRERAGIETYSEGDEPHRCVVVAPLVAD